MATANITPTVAEPINAETLALLAHLGFTADDVKRRADKIAKDTVRETFAGKLAPVLAEIVDAVPLAESGRSTWKGHSVDNMPFEHNGKTYTAKVIVTLKD